jgi:hypothetical protein
MSWLTRILVGVLVALAIYFIITALGWVCSFPG